MNKIAVILIYFILSSKINYAQSAAPSREEMRQYKIQYGFQEKVVTTYKMSCSTKIERTDADNKIQIFNREIEVYLNFYRPSRLENGFAEIRTIYDSITYKYDDGKNRYKWSSSTGANDPFPKVDDYFNLIFPMVGRTYNTTISPYFEVAKIEGERLDEKRNEIDSIPNAFTKAVWGKANSDDNLIFYSDMNKNVIRSGRFAIDSAWKMVFTIPIEGIRYTCDTADVKFYLYDGKNFNIKAEMKEMYPNSNDSACVIEISNKMLKASPTNNSKGFWDIAISPRGLVNKVIGQFETDANYSVDDTEFKDKITTNIKYEFLSTLRWAD
jgi:hypothetical protein